MPGVQVMGKNPLGVLHCVSSRLSKKTPHPTGGGVRGGGATTWRPRIGSLPAGSVVRCGGCGSRRFVASFIIDSGHHFP
jgi:hypothetical protein